MSSQDESDKGAQSKPAQQKAKAGQILVVLDHPKIIVFNGEQPWQCHQPSHGPHCTASSGYRNVMNCPACLWQKLVNDIAWTEGFILELIALYEKGDAHEG